ncbi:phospho-N-acetylmuramoyl-pentapeptide-transferase [Desulfuribacillus alkaliarsenatis]|uniref:Phospho-N-acetylmuramoyl-pentapeptide-transferase n=1 Tax=Desulfuribacillus alkaliarsenatis TaxID=766136 RepID=A0A1E5FZS2_9FIRM|nr:phospho-N-acetylmuramoyl-pentapeptide-transferase [Desulfuribacillus alkaliarsenatis]OEF96076.1 phospho-N-acetylmuramoyl-pentapeptide-transferase [Desulfuribacillus alkaliarsenatis]
MDYQIVLIAVIVSTVISAILGPLLIPILQRLKFGQSIRVDGPQKHLQKAGTPTMGGVMIIIALSITALQFANNTITLFLLALVTIGYGLIGFTDDYIKVVMKRNLGLTAKQKLVAQILLATIFYWFLIQTNHDTAIYLPGTTIGFELGWIYLPFVVFIMIGTTNAVNLTDGLDGLLAGVSSIVFTVYALIAIYMSQFDVAIFSASVVGACLGFLLYNAHPAKVFMGDTGSLALGGALVGIAILTKTELLLVIVGAIFVIEALSVIIQVIFFKWKKIRIFKMSPIHHHFELSGWSEWKVVIVFWSFTLITALLGLVIQFKL